MSVSAGPAVPRSSELRGLREENQTLYGVIKLVSSSLEMLPMLQGVVDLATEATGCHACFIYLLEGDRLTIRAASPVFADAVGTVQMGLDEGLTGWVARHRTPEFIRDKAMADPRMKYIPELEEERFQSMVAVPILARAGDTIGVIVLHTQAPHEFTEDTLKLLVHIASLVSGAIENAQLYDQQRRRVDASRGSRGSPRRSPRGDERSRLGAGRRPPGLRLLLGADVCQLYRVDSATAALAAVARDPETALPGPALSATGLLLAAIDGGGERPAGAHAVAGARRGRPAGHAADRRRRARRPAVRGSSGRGARSPTRTPSWRARSPT